MLYMTGSGIEVHLVNGKVVKQPSEQLFRDVEKV